MENLENSFYSRRVAFATVGLTCGFIVGRFVLGERTLSAIGAIGFMAMASYFALVLWAIWQLGEPPTLHERKFRWGIATIPIQAMIFATIIRILFSFKLTGITFLDSIIVIGISATSGYLYYLFLLYRLKHPKIEGSYGRFIDPLEFYTQAETYQVIMDEDSGVGKFINAPFIEIPDRSTVPTNHFPFLMYEGFRFDLWKFEEGYTYFGFITSAGIETNDVAYFQFEAHINYQDGDSENLNFILIIPRIWAFKPKHEFADFKIVAHL